MKSNKLPSDNYLNEVPDNDSFLRDRASWIDAFQANKKIAELRSEIFKIADENNFGYHWEWLGVPLIKMPEDILLEQEIIWKLKPKTIVEIGVARGGSLVFASSIMESYADPKVLGIDIKIFAHTHEALSPWTVNQKITLFESDSLDPKAITKFSEFIENAGPTLLILDSNHTHEHVLGELHSYGPKLSRGSVIIVADTIIESMPANYYVNRNWNVGNNPQTALQVFLRSNNNFEISKNWNNRTIIGESNGGVIVKIS